MVKNPFSDRCLSDLVAWLDVQLGVLSDANFYTPHFECGLRDKPEFDVLYDFWQRYPIIRGISSHPSFYKALLPVLGQDIFLYENSFLFKTPNTLDHVPWHQDFMNRPDEPLKYFAFISVDSFRHDHGALMIIPASYKNGFYPYRVRQGQAHHTGIPEDQYGKLQLNNTIYIDQDQGDILIFNQLLVHSLDPISSDNNCACRSFRFSYQGFNQMFVPRHTPISLFGGDPASINHRAYIPHPKSIHRRPGFLTFLAKMKSKLQLS